MIRTEIHAKCFLPDAVTLDWKAIRPGIGTLSGHLVHVTRKKSEHSYFTNMLEAFASERDR